MDPSPIAPIPARPAVQRSSGQGGGSGSNHAGGVGHQIDLGDGAEDVGTLIAQDGLWSLYERNLGHGRKVVTSVIWAE